MLYIVICFFSHYYRLFFLVTHMDGFIFLYSHVFFHFFIFVCNIKRWKYFNPVASFCVFVLLLNMLTTDNSYKKRGEYGLLIFQHKKNLETVKSLLTLNTGFNLYHFKFCIYVYILVNTTCILHTSRMSCNSVYIEQKNFVWKMRAKTFEDTLCTCFSVI